MSSTEASSSTSTETPEAGTIDMKLEVVAQPGGIGSPGRGAPRLHR